MPIYEYRCKECENEFDELASFTEPNPPCPECKGTTEKLISRTISFVKGSEKRSLDSVIGESAEKNWQYIDQRKKNRKMKKGIK